MISFVSGKGKIVNAKAPYHTFAPVLEIAPPSDKDTSAHVNTAAAAVAAIEDDDIPDVLDL